MEEDFGYKHISLGEILRKEILKGTKEGDRVRKLMQDGAIIPYETVVHCIMKEMLDNKSKCYVLEGFPRAQDQAQYFEQSVCEIQQMIFIDTPVDELERRLQERCKTSDRMDDKPEIIKKRITNYKDHTVTAVDYYKTFGKVRMVNGD